MTAQSIGIFTIEFPDPYSLPYYNDKFTTISSNISFQYLIEDDIRTLSTNGASSGTDPYGILYVPNLSSDDCINAEKDLVSPNATRRHNLPNTDYSLVAMAPWLSPQCVLEYFASTRGAPIKAFIFYLPGNGTDTPPLTSDPTWGLGDGGSWKMNNHFPVYAIPGLTGSIIMNQLALYSGNVTAVPHGHDLASMYSPTDYIRLWATIDTGHGNQLPSLWIFLVIVLGLLILIIGSTSFIMRLLQRKRRDRLRQRVINGEVDLEALGIKRLTVPQEYLDKMPLFNYIPEPSLLPQKEMEPNLQPPTNPPMTPSPLSSDSEPNPISTPARRSSAPSINTTTTASHSTFSQPTCPICLDDFIPNITPVRELPCRHIFHPGCVDTFLLRNSSLCPMCKKSTLPKGYCPANVTNAMVRREQMIRRIRERVRDDGGGQAGGFPDVSGQSVTVLVPTQQRGAQSERMRNGLLISGTISQAMAGRRVFSAPARTERRPADIEMGTAAQPTATTSSNPALNPTAAGTRDDVTTVTSTVPSSDDTPASDLASSPPPPPSVSNRREWARQRALALLGTRQAPEEIEWDEQERQRSRWRKVFGKVFPRWR
ncbi:uncharacterized protein K441DRAFT_622381 [Cenococcum geophilum 1.58]|uniref:Uncharacterized protein n=1 Tax=Cenococcum geophilum 1.58 TaxID=794803 RepID=A0ACC8ENP9_9PEZI|nr:hypothetical protein K441DRAFT_622381 [Cenococcum geophilum 1.58]